MSRRFAAALRLPALLMALALASGGCSQRVIDALGLGDVTDAGPATPRRDTSGPADAEGPGDVPADPGPDAGPGEPVMPVPSSCAAILAANPDAPDGVYVIDPDGEGGGAPFSVTCDMRSKDGGWTRLFFDDFTKGATGYSRTMTTMCGAFGTILGGYKTFGSEIISNTVDLRRIPHKELRVRFDYIVLDSWDKEQAFARVDGTQFGSQNCDEGIPSTCRQTVNNCGWNGTGNLDGRVPVDEVVPHTLGTAKVEWGAVLDQANEDESWGLDNVSILVR